MFVVFVLSQLLVSHTHCDQRTPTARHYPDVFTPERCSPVLCCYCSDYLSCIECPQYVFRDTGLPLFEARVSGF